MAEKLPKINPAKLQRVIDDAEKVKPFKSLDDLCMKVAQTNWASENELDHKTVAALIAEHKPTMKTGKEQPKPPVITKEQPKPPVITKEQPKPPVITKEQPKPPVTAEPPKPVAPVVSKDEDDDSDEVKTYKDGGRGRKQCPKCRKYVGARVGVCACGNDFGAGNVSEAGNTTSHVRMPNDLAERESKAGVACSRYGCKSVLWVPAGKPPALKGTSLKQIEEWAEQIRKERKEKDNLFVSMQALTYYASHNMREDAALISERLQEIYPGE